MAWAMKYLPQHSLKSYIWVTYIYYEAKASEKAVVVIVFTTTGKQNKTASLIYLSFYLTELRQFFRLSSLLFILALHGFSYACEGRTL